MSARICSNEIVDVIEVTGKKFSKVLKKASKFVEENDDFYAWFSINTFEDELGNQGLIIYAHS